MQLYELKIKEHMKTIDTVTNKQLSNEIKNLRRDVKRIINILENSRTIAVDDIPKTARNFLNIIRRKES